MECLFNLFSKKIASTDWVHILTLHENGEYHVIRRRKEDNYFDSLEMVNCKLYDKGSEKSITVFIAANFHSLTTLNNFTPTDVFDVNLQVLGDGGSIIFPDGAGSIPGLRGRLDLSSHETAPWAELIIHDTVAVNGAHGETFHLRKDTWLVLEDEKGNKIRFAVRQIIGKAAIVEYEWISREKAYAELDDDWEPLLIDRGNLLVEESAESIGDVAEALAGDNGYRSTKPEEAAEVIETLESTRDKLKTERYILARLVRRAFEVLKKATKTFYKGTIIWGKIAIAMENLTRLAKGLWNLIIDNDGIG